MNKRKKSIAEEEEELDDILRDGQSVRVPLYLRDGAINPDLTPTQRAKALQQTQTEDAVARRFGLTDAMQLHRPGFRRNTDAGALARVQQAYTDAETADANAWKGATNRLNLRDQQEGDPCTVRGPDYPDDFGSPGTLQMGNDGELVCVPGNLEDARRQDAASVKRAAYEQYDREMANAWRTRR
jgi:hypothetical protein